MFLSGKKTEIISDSSSKVKYTSCTIYHFPGDAPLFYNTKVLRPAIAYLSSLKIRIVCYSVDILLMASPEQMKEDIVVKGHSRKKNNSARLDYKLGEVTVAPGQHVKATLRISDGC